MLKIREIEEVVGIKQVGIEELVAMVSACEDRIKVFSACDDMLYGTYVSGACGAISAMITAVPELCVKQWKAFKKGDQKTAMEIQRKLYFVREAYNFTPFPGMLKEIINQLGRKVGKSRSPILEPTKKEKEFIRKKLMKAGLL